MELIKFKRSGGPVTFKVSIDQLVEWRYTYNADGKTFSKKLDQNPGTEHALGVGDELDGDYNNWDVIVVNTTDNEITVTARIEWYQDGAEKHDWHDTKKVDKNEKTEILSGSAVLKALKSEEGNA